MIYYICIMTPTQTDTTTYFPDMAKNVMHGHSQVGNKPPRITNQPCVFLAINNKEGLKQITFKPEDEVRLAVHGLSTGYRHFNIEEFTHVKDIFDVLIETKVKVSPQVIYA